MLEKISGVHAILEALTAEDRKIEQIYFNQGTRKGRLKEIEDKASFLNIPVEFIAPSQLTKLCGHNHHQGVLAMTRPFQYVDVETLLSLSVERTTPPFLLVIDQVQDPRNLGAIIRNAEGAGVDGIIMTKKRTSPLTEAVVQTSAGACEHLKICRVVNLVHNLEHLKTLGIWIIGADPHGSRTMYDIDGNDALAIVIGNENRGLRQLVKKTCDYLVKIPMFGSIKSLNVAASAALILYEIRRQRSFQKDPHRNQQSLFDPGAPQEAEQSFEDRL
ncbi:23S rRNA (guanosine(2251)-2'-O)-methyltransferase RlmB [candidate division CSSED10-310 bacterium]|uniref:23S rRNA (Guanosine(2251)-2'-O)-methyltransferase RlmB n=1 Tax=candidate division CSSED10-310 bacterium TaxID=2855610 RepID=A0ABV6Z128_UNCC1